MQKHKFASISFYFCVKCKSAFISEMVRDRVISTKFWNHRVSAESTGDFSQESLSRHLNFCVKCKSAFISETVQDRAISTKFWNRKLSAECTGDIFSKITFSPFCGGHLEFLCKTQNTFIWEIIRDRVISTKYMTYMLSVKSTGDFSQKSLSRHFWQPS